jgi:hypothetical protein
MNSRSIGITLYLSQRCRIYWMRLDTHGRRLSVEQSKIKESDIIIQFFIELNSLDWSPDNTIFLGEVSFDNRAMTRKKGYSLKGTKLLFRGQFTRKPRISLLCFINDHGLLESFMTADTFNRQNLWNVFGSL